MAVTVCIVTIKDRTMIGLYVYMLAEYGGEKDKGSEEWRTGN